MSVDAGALGAKLEWAEKQCEELQAFLEQAQAENDQLREELAARPSAEAIKDVDALVAERVKSSNKQLQAEFELTLAAGGLSGTTRQRAEDLQQWLTDAEQENVILRSKLDGLERGTQERTAMLEASMGSMMGQYQRVALKLADVLKNDVTRLQSELRAAQAAKSGAEVTRLEAELAGARNVVQQLEQERDAALAQVQALVGDASSPRLEAALKSLQGLVEDRQSSVVSLEARLHAAQSAEASLKSELEVQRFKTHELERECSRLRVPGVSVAQPLSLAELDGERRRASQAEERLESAETERAKLANDCARLRHELATAMSHLESLGNNPHPAAKAPELEVLQRRVASAEERLESAETERAKLANDCSRLKHELATAMSHLEALGRAQPASTPEVEALQKRAASAEERLASAEAERARLEAALAHAPPLVMLQPPPAPKEERVVQPPPPPTEALVSADLERAAALERELERMRARSDDADRYAKGLVEELARGRTALETAHDRLVDAVTRHADDVAVTDALAQVASALGLEGAEVLSEGDLVAEPLQAVDALTQAQAVATERLTKAVEADVVAREQTLSDLNWLKIELEKLTHVRDELKARLESMVQRELKRKATMTALLGQLRMTEVSSSMRMAAMRRVQSAISAKAKAEAATQTVFFQRQIGSLQRQLEMAQGRRRFG